ncbi:MAG TPA: hypothetical protein V6D20_25005, partial [Candidatus Obscuribacterales bacterium]
PFTVDMNMTNTMSTGLFYNLGGVDVQLDLLSDSAIDPAVAVEGTCESIDCNDDCGETGATLRDACFTHDYVMGANYYLMFTFFGTPNYPAFGVICNNQTQVTCETNEFPTDQYGCVSNSECATDSPSTPYCVLSDDGSSSSCSQCRTDSECYSTEPTCDTTMGRCVFSCDGDDDCPVDEYCSDEGWCVGASTMGTALAFLALL